MSLFPPFSSNVSVLFPVSKSQTAFRVKMALYSLRFALAKDREREREVPDSVSSLRGEKEISDWIGLDWIGKIFGPYPLLLLDF